MRPRLGLFPAAALLLGSSIVVIGQQTTRPLVFRAEANYTEIYATVTDRDGRFVFDLKPDDFELKEEGRVHPIELVTLVDLPMDGSARATLPPIFNPELPREMQAVENRIYLLYLNPVEPQYVTRVRELAATFVREHLLPGDVAAVWDPGLPARRIAFTNSRSLLLSAISPYLGTSLGLDDDLSFALSCTPGGIGSLPANQRERCEHYLRAPKTRLEEALKWFSGIQGRRKSVVLFAAGWPSDADPATSTDVQVYAVDVRGLVPPDRALGAALSSNAADVNGAIQSRLSDLSRSTEHMASLADRTGGFAIVNQNEHRPGFTRIVEHNSRYYVLGYKSTLKRRDGDYRTVDVKVKRPGLRVYARRGYYAY
jgi:VWFA-related protein